MSQMNSSMNFLPEDYVEKRQAARAAVVFIGLLLIVVGGIVGAYLYSGWGNRDVFNEGDRTDAAYEDASKQIAKAQELEAQKEKMIQKAEITSTLMERIRRSVLLSELTRLKPKGMNFVDIELKSKDLTGPAPARQSDLRRQADSIANAVKPPPVDVTLQLIGTTPTDADVSAYMGALKKSDLLKDVTLQFSEAYQKNKEDVPLRKFSLEMHLNPDADMRDQSVVEAAQKN